MWMGSMWKEATLAFKVLAEHMHGGKPQNPKYGLSWPRFEPHIPRIQIRKGTS